MIVAIFAIYSLTMMLHEEAWINHSVDNAMEFDIVENANFAFAGIIPFENGRMGQKNIYDVNSIPDFWSWFGMGLVPLLFMEAGDVSEPRANVLAMCTTAEDALLSFGWPE